MSLSRFLDHTWYDFAYGVMWLSYTFGFSLRDQGHQNLPREGPFLAVCNHQSFLDPIAVGLACRRRMYFLARATLFRNPLLGGLLRTVHSVPVDQEGVAKEGLKKGVQLLEQGKPLLIFPEGHRTHDGHMLPMQPGVLLLIRRTEVPVVPVGIAGAYEAFPRDRKMPRTSPLFLSGRGGGIAVSVGKPMHPKPFLELPREEALARMAGAIRAVQERAERLRRKC